MNEPSPIILN